MKILAFTWSKAASEEDLHPRPLPCVNAVAVSEKDFITGLGELLKLGYFTMGTIPIGFRADTHQISLNSILKRSLLPQSIQAFVTFQRKPIFFIFPSSIVRYSLRSGSLYSYRMFPIQGWN
jgi:hypothetical protein